MKYLILIAVVFGFAWYWRASRSKSLAQRKQTPQKNMPPVNMVACAQCGVHLPASDAITGAQGSYCCAAHRHSAEH